MDRGGDPRRRSVSDDLGALNRFEGPAYSKRMTRVLFEATEQRRRGQISGLAERQRLTRLPVSPNFDEIRWAHERLNLDLSILLEGRFARSRDPRP